MSFMNYYNLIASILLLNSISLYCLPNEESHQFKNSFYGACASLIAGILLHIKNIQHRNDNDQILIHASRDARNAFFCIAVLWFLYSIHLDV